MKIARPILFGLILAAVFYVWTSHHFGGTCPVSWVTRQPVEILQAAGPQAFDNEEQNNIDVYKRVSPAVVNITSTAVAFDFFYGAVPQEGQGSGFIIDKEGHILTNYHVVENARQLEVTLSNRKKYTASVVGLDKSHDLGRHTDQSSEPHSHGDGRLEVSASWPEGLCHRQPVRPEWHYDERHGEFDPLSAHA